MSTTPWDIAALQYVGWVPNALGHLSFSLIGQGTSPPAHAATLASGTHGQHVVAYQLRKADDYGLPNQIMRMFRSGSVHDWVLIASTAPATYPNSKRNPSDAPFIDERGMLVGKIYLLAAPNRTESTRAEQRAARQLRKEFRSRATGIIREAIHSRGADVPADEQNGKMRDLIQDLGGRGAIFAPIEFALLRTGEARFWIENDTLFESRTSQDAVVKNSFLFLKDVTHRHAHHHPSQDSLLPLVTIGPGQEVEWQRQTIWALSRSIEDNIRRRRRTNLREALGTIPFAENFSALYSGLMRSHDGKDGFVKIETLDHYSYESLRKSVTVQLETKSGRLTFMTAVLASFFAITLSSIIAIGNMTFRPGAAWPPFLISWVAGHPVITLAVILTTLWMGYETLYREAVLDISIFAPTRFLRRLLWATTASLSRRMWLPRVSSAAFSFLLQLTLFVLTILGLIALLRIG